MQSRNQKQPLMAIFGAYVVLVALLVIVIPPLHVGQTTLAGCIALLCGLGCIYWSTVRIPMAANSSRPNAFTSEFIVSLAFAEMVALVGTFFGSSREGRYPFAAAAWILMFGFILPKLLWYSKR